MLSTHVNKEQSFWESKLFQHDFIKAWTSTITVLFYILYARYNESQLQDKMIVIYSIIIISCHSFSTVCQIAAASAVGEIDATF